jgi:hypothetical protein
MEKKNKTATSHLIFMPGGRAAVSADTVCARGTIPCQEQHKVTYEVKENTKVE